MPRIRFLIAAVLALAILAAPGFARARAGDGGSFGSRGSMTYSAPPATRTAPYSAAPMQRSMTPNTPSYGNQGYAGQSSFGGGGFMSGLMGGLIGAGIGGMLFGHGFFGGGMHGFGLFGVLIQLFLIYWVGKFIYRTFFSGQPVMANGPNLFSRGGMMGGGMPGAGGGGFGGSGLPPIQIGPGDYQQFEQLLKGIQAAWSAHDLNGLQAMATPEMVGYFNEQLSVQASRGVRNVVGDVALVSGDLSQAWAENGREYATVAMRFSMTDTTYDGAGRIVDGSPTEHVTATEIWTFVRSGGGHWVLSAIQQAR